MFSWTQNIRPRHRAKKWTESFSTWKSRYRCQNGHIMPRLHTSAHSVVKCFRVLSLEHLKLAVACHATPREAFRGRVSIETSSGTKTRRRQRDNQHVCQGSVNPETPYSSISHLQSGSAHQKSTFELQCNNIRHLIKQAGQKMMIISVSYV